MTTNIYDRYRCHIAYIDIVGLRRLAADLRTLPPDLERPASAGAADLAALDLWADRATFLSLVDAQVRRMDELTRDLDIRALVLEEAEAMILGLGWSGGSALASTSPTQRVNDALAEIEELLRTDGTRILIFSHGDTDVSREEMTAVADILEGLSRIELWSLCQQMDDQLLATLLDEADANGIDDARLERLFRYLAEHAGASSLGRMMLLSDAGTRDHLVRAVREHSTGFVQKWVFDEVVAHLSEDDEHPAVATALLAGMSPEMRRLALVQLDGRGGLIGFLASLVHHEKGHPGGWWGRVFDRSPTVQTAHDYDASLLVDLLDALAETDDPDLKARVFVAAVGNLADPLAMASEQLIQRAPGNVFDTHRFEDDSGKAALGALTVLLIGDPEGMLDALRLDADVRGSATSDFFRELLRAPGHRPDSAGEPLSHQGAIQANQVLAAIFGPHETAAERAAFFQALEPTSGGTVDYVNASRLGYFAGTISSALDDLGTAEDEEWTAIGIILGAAGLVDPIKVGGSVELVYDTLTEIGEEISDATIEELRLEYQGFEYALVEEIIPRDRNGYRFDGDAADEFLNTYDRVGGVVLE